MQLPHPFNRSPLPESPPPFSDAAALAVWRRRDERARVHNLARQVALFATKTARVNYLDDLARRHDDVFMARFKRVMRWYWIRQRRLQQGA